MPPGKFTANKAELIYRCGDETLPAAPRCPGVYRFYSDDDVLLYIGKSVDIGTRLNSHLAEAREPGRHQRMMSNLHRVECELTAGDIGAQLLENAAIKAENPLYNRRQRRVRKLWTQRLIEDVEGFLQIAPSDFCPGGERHEAVYGLFRSQRHLQESVRSLARDQGLCLRMLGQEKGQGPCFQQQIGRCQGACAGEESADEHNARLLAALERQRIAAWPFAGAIILEEEREGESHPLQPRRQYHVLHHWSYLGTFARRDQARRAARSQTLEFDRDGYRIAYRALRGRNCRLVDAEHGDVLASPFVTAA